MSKDVIRVLHVYRTYFPDLVSGVAEAIRQICLATSPLGVQNTIFALSPQPEPQVLIRPEANVMRCRSWAAPASCDLGGPSAFRQFSALLHDTDVVVYHFPWPFADLLHSAARAKTPALMLYHSDIVRQRWLGGLYAPLMQRTLRAMSAIVATSPAYARTSPVLTAPDVRDKVRVIPLGIEDISQTPSTPSDILSRSGLNDGAPYFLFVGALRYYKGLHTLIRAAQQVRARIVIAGGGDEAHRLKAQAQSLGVDNVVFAGHVSDAEKIALLKHCRAFVFPSHLRSEAFGVALIEAAMYGRPLISCEIGTGTSYVNQHGESGFVVPPEDAPALAAALNTLLNDDVLAERYGRGARARYERLFSSVPLGRAYVELYRALSA